MKKIFKYDYDRETGRVVMPENASVIRIAHVDDGFYKGDFLWAIVTVGDANVERFVTETALREILYPELLKTAMPLAAPGTFERVELRVKEKQTVSTKGYPIAAGEEDGKLYLYCAVSPLSEGDYEIAFYKTGQEIDIPVKNLRYVGLNRIWIIQELGLYTFIVQK